MEKLVVRSSGSCVALPSSSSSSSALPSSSPLPPSAESHPRRRRAPHSGACGGAEPTFPGTGAALALALASAQPSCCEKLITCRRRARSHPGDGGCRNSRPRRSALSLPTPLNPAAPVCAAAAVSSSGGECAHEGPHPYPSASGARPSGCTFIARRLAFRWAAIAFR